MSGAPRNTKLYTCYLSNLQDILCGKEHKLQEGAGHTLILEGTEGNEKTLTPWKESYEQPRQHIKKQRHYFANKGPSHQGFGFSSSHVWM